MKRGQRAVERRREGKRKMKRRGGLGGNLKGRAWRRHMTICHLKRNTLKLAVGAEAE